MTAAAAAAAISKLPAPLAERVDSLHAVSDLVDAVLCLVENAVVHGGAARVEAHVSRQLDVRVDDDGVGLTRAALDACGVRAGAGADAAALHWARRSLSHLAALSR
jgi:DNA mismatch repair ATPase MutL